MKYDELVLVDYLDIIVSLCTWIVETALTRDEFKGIVGFDWPILPAIC